MNEDSGLACISIKEVRNLLLTDSIDVYCVLSIDTQIIRTSTNTISPGAPLEWFEGYTFDVTNSNAILSIVVWSISSSNPAGRSLGRLLIPIENLKNSQEAVEHTSVLLDEDGASTSIELKYRAQYSSLAGKRKIGFDDFIMLQFLGKGTFGKVMLVRKKDTNRLYAMKVMRKDKLYRDSATAVPLIERDVLKKYNHPYVVHLKYAFQTETHLYMVMDYLNGGDLFDLMVTRNVLDEDTVRFYTAQIILAITFLHEHDIIYRDLKPENLLIDMNGNMCLVDFGLCKEGIFGDDVTHTFCGSLQYMAPEVLKGEGYGKSVDWWALGVIMYEMLTGNHPFIQFRNGSFNEKELIHNIVHESAQFSSRLGYVPKTAIRLILNLLQKDPRKRLGSGPKGGEDIKNHAFFDGINWKKLSKKELPPPFKPHLKDQSSEMNIHKAPWASSQFSDSRNNSPAFQLLNDSEQECFQSFSYTAPTELSRSRSSPGFYLLGTSPVPSPRLLGRISGNFAPVSPRKKMTKSPGLSGLANYDTAVDDDDQDYVDEAEAEAGGRVRMGTTIRRQRRRWSLSNFHVDPINIPADSGSDTDRSDGADVDLDQSDFDNSDEVVKNVESGGKLKKSMGKSFLSTIFGKKQ